MKFRVEPGYQIELVAAEPLVESPCALAWDEQGRFFIAENRGYPVGAPDGSPQGRIALLQDTDGDGRGGHRVEFAAGLMYPNGMLPWRGGLLVTDAPNLYWLSDTNGDGVADVREVWFTGFATNHSTQLRACYPTLGPDGWIYVSRGLAGGVITSPKWPNLAPVDLKNGDFRFLPDGAAAEAIGGNAQFGLVIDDVGRRFLVSNRNPLIHAVVPPSWWKRVPWLPFTDLVQDVSPTGYAAKVHPLSPDMTTASFTTEFISAPHAGTFTSACGIHQFFGEGLGPEMQGSWFICEPAQNLVQRQIAEPDGPTFRSHAVPGDREFLASADPWFHPVSAWTGPDGCLYLADMYRKFIDHPDYLPTEVRPKLDFNSGKNMGRIWRIRTIQREVGMPDEVGQTFLSAGGRGFPAARPGATGKSPEPADRNVRTTADAFRRSQRRLDSYDTKELVDALESQNIWARQTANRLLLDRSATNVMELVVAKLESELGVLKQEPGEEWSKALARWAARREESEPLAGPHLGRARMVRLLYERLATFIGPDKVLREIPDALARRVTEILWLSAIMAREPSVREAGWRVLQSTSDEHNPIPDVGEDLLRIWSDDPSPAVRFHLAYCLGQGDYTRMTESLVNIVRRHPDDRWTRAVVLSGLAQRSTEFLNAFFAPKFRELTGAPLPPIGFDDSPGMVALAEDMGRLYGAGYGAQGLWERALAPSADGTTWQLVLLRGLAEGVRQRFGKDSAGKPALFAMAERFAKADPQSAQRLAAVAARAGEAAKDPQAPIARRANAMAFLGEMDFEHAAKALEPLLAPTQPRDVQASAARAMAGFDTLEAAQALLEAERWAGYPPPVREIVLGRLLSRTRQLSAVLEAVEKGIVPVWAIPANRRKQLLRDPDSDVQARAERLFAGSGAADRKQTYDQYKDVLALKGSGQSGHAVFLRVCSICHQHGGEGAKVGPDLTGVNNQAPEALLLHILVPDAEIYSGYESYDCETKDGRSLTGILAAESETSITLRRALGEQDVIARDQIVSLIASRTSLMPAELEKTMTRQELADLLAFLRGDG